MSNCNWKEVRFDVWCKSCVYESVRDDLGEDPCNTCMAESARKNSTKPVKHKSKLGRSTTN